MPATSGSIDFEQQRRQMVDQQLAARGISDETVLRAMGSVPREVFVPVSSRRDAYRDGPLPIGEGQTISQPYMVALMTELLRIGPQDSVLEIGTGSGYQSAVLHAITPRVYSIERIPALARRAEAVLHASGCSSVEIRTGDGTLGWPEKAPFNAIIVTSAAPDVPRTLKEQLADGGRLVVPAGTRYLQTLYCIERRGPDFSITEHSGCVFVPLIGEHGWSDEQH